MTVDPGLDVRRLAAAARSILACPHEVQLVVDGLDDVTSGLDESVLEMQDHGGRPLLSCPADSALALAATDRRGALLTVTSGLGTPGSTDRDAMLTLSGRLDALGIEQCECCDELRMRVGLDLDFILLARASAPDDAPDETRVRVPLAAFTSPEHDLNRGFLQRSTEHANQCHQDELRRAVSALSQTRLGDVVGVQLTGLRAEGVELRWVDPTGAHRTLLRFPRPATSAAELGELLRTELHAGLC
ncbi:DUF2470 domain-containing protein [Nocardioides nitrophenolicus]|uniref:DUF2470 domain-containing protein n=1 Tax=Nocardioides nitrophenolicus TaxID=60489 RepID=UPI0019574E96|nr:DUF2470 domain-containing protein [Nocardioides nitrophenolicus]MBM7519754.1 hypothetical protein [Nocardioides nitrophenolicus]